MRYSSKLIETRTHGGGSRSMLIKTVPTPVVPPVEPEPVITCDGATSYLSFTLSEPMEGYTGNHNTLVYNVELDGVDFGELDLSYGAIQLADLTLDVIVGSEGGGNMYASTANGSMVPRRFKFTPKSDMTDANFWGVDVESNPTVVYNSVDRSIKVCMTPSGNT